MDDTQGTMDSITEKIKMEQDIWDTFENKGRNHNNPKNQTNQASVKEFEDSFSTILEDIYKAKDSDEAPSEPSELDDTPKSPEKELDNQVIRLSIFESRGNFEAMMNQSLQLSDVPEVN